VAVIESSDPRSAIAQALGSFLTPNQVEHLVNEILAINKRVSAEFTCKHCKRSQKHWVDIPDARSVTSGIAELANQAYGRPSETDRASQPINFFRITVSSEDEMEQAIAAVTTAASSSPAHAEQPSPLRFSSGVPLHPVANGMTHLEVA
jgi:hypothetical protein